jgi:hypothetical protein
VRRKKLEVRSEKEEVRRKKLEGRREFLGKTSASGSHRHGKDCNQLIGLVEYRF